jgi:hypothetical protein
MMSAITAVPHDLLDLRSVGNADIPQCLVIEFRQTGNGVFDRTLAPPMRPSACDGKPRVGQPIAVT